jgi:hypothetical protein
MRYNFLRLVIVFLKGFSELTVIPGGTAAMCYLTAFTFCN